MLLSKNRVTLVFRMGCIIKKFYFYIFLSCSQTEENISPYYGHEPAIGRNKGVKVCIHLNISTVSTTQQTHLIGNLPLKTLARKRKLYAWKKGF